MPSPLFGEALFTFLRDLAANNDRDWFKANKARYEAEVKAPLLSFINAFAPKLEKLGPCFVADSRPSGGSMFRIYRDTRFSKDKSPYKTHAAVHFRHRAGKDVHAPGFYLHLEPDNVFMGAGLWRPEPKVATAIRDGILEHPEAWKKATRRKAFTDRFELSGESLKRKPKNVEDDDHPWMEDLKRKDFIAVQNFEPGAALEGSFLATFSASCKTAAPFMRFLTDAIGLDYD